jgi:hypothetical protein
MKKRPDLGIKWNAVLDWKVESRYESSGLNGTDMLDAVVGPEGVLTWIQQRW